MASQEVVARALFTVARRSITAPAGPLQGPLPRRDGRPLPPPADSPRDRAPRVRRLRLGLAEGAGRLPPPARLKNQQIEGGGHASQGGTAGHEQPGRVCQVGQAAEEAGRQAAGIGGAIQGNRHGKDQDLLHLHHRHPRRRLCPAHRGADLVPRRAHVPPPRGLAGLGGVVRFAAVRAGRFGERDVLVPVVPGHVRARAQGRRRVNCSAEMLGFYTRAVGKAGACSRWQLS